MIGHLPGVLPGVLPGILRGEFLGTMFGGLFGTLPSRRTVGRFMYGKTDQERGAVVVGLEDRGR